MNEIPYFCFASFARSLKESFKDKISDFEIVSLLLEFVIFRGDVRSGVRVDGKPVDKPYEISANKANRLMNRLDVVYSGIVEAASDPEVISAAEQHFSKYVVPRINPHAVDDLIKKIKLLIQEDHIAEKKAQELFSEADAEHLGPFLAKTFVYSLGRNNKSTPDGRKKKALQTATSGAMTAEGAALILPEEKLNLVVETVISRIFQLDQIRKLEGLRFQSFMEDEFHQAIQLLVNDGRMSYTELYHCKNFLQIAEMADEYIRQQAEADEEADLNDADDESFVSSEFDFDWLIKFYEACGSVSNEEVQQLWAKILAGEIRRNGSFSIRAIDIMRNMSLDEARLFKEIGKIAFEITPHRHIVYAMDNGDDSSVSIHDPINSSDIAPNFKPLIECGIISRDITSDYTYINCKTWLYNNFIKSFGFKIQEYLLDFKPKSIIHLIMYRIQKHKSYLFTSAGEELLPLVQGEVNFQYLRLFIRAFDWAYRARLFACGNLVSRENTLNPKQVSINFKNERDLFSELETLTELNDNDPK